MAAHLSDALTYRRQLGVNGSSSARRPTCAEVTNAKPLPLSWLRVEDVFPAALEITPESAVRLWPRAAHVGELALYALVRARSGATARGWRARRLASGRPIGRSVRLCDQAAAGRGADTLLVYPKLLPLTAFGLPALRPFGELRTVRRLTEDPLQLTGARPYAPGDSYRHIHWKATAHRRELQTKVFDPAAARPVAIFINVNTSRYLFEGTDYELREYAISAGASIARWVCDQGQPAGVYVNAVMQPGAQRVRIRPRAHPEQLTEILDALARVTGYGRWSMGALIAAEARHLPYGSAIVAVSATVTDELLRALLDLQARGSAAVLVTLGDDAQASIPAGIRRYHIGGKQEWRELATLALA